MSLIDTAAELRDALRALSFQPPVAYVYNPLEYAWQAHCEYLHRFGGLGAETILVGMNPGPWGMAQTGVPFGAVSLVESWLGIKAVVGKPEHEHPKRPVDGFACPREEVSGARLWGWARDLFGTPEAFFKRIFIGNYCPLLFLEESARNLTPDKLKAADREALLPLCDRALRRTVEELGVSAAIGVGAWAEKRVREALLGLDVKVGRVLHPSPASPAANRGWAEAATRQLRAFGLELPEPVPSVDTDEGAAQK